MEYKWVKNMRLQINNLNVSINDKKVLKDFNLQIEPSTTHVIMGPNGVGKSTLTKVIMGDANYKVVNGNIYFDDTLINNLTTDERARLGLFLGMQLPPEIEGVTNADMLRTACHSKQQEEFKLFSFIKELEQNYSEKQADIKGNEVVLNNQTDKELENTLKIYYELNTKKEELTAKLKNLKEKYT